MNWPAIIEAAQTKEFELGLTIGMIVFGLMWMYSGVQKARYLWECAQQKSAVKIGDGFYYIVPEKVYNKFDVPAAYAARQLEAQQAQDD